MDFPIVTRIPLNRTGSGIPTVSLLWAWIIDNRYRLSAVIVARNTKSWGTEEPRKTSHMHMNRLVVLEVALKSHDHLGTSQRQHKKLSLQVCWQNVSFSGYIFSPSVNLLWKIIWVCHVILVEVCTIRPLVWPNDTWK